MRVLYLIPTLGGGGAERQARQLLLGMAKGGIDVAVYSQVEKADVAFLSANGITVCEIGDVGNYSLRRLFDLAAFVVRWKPDVIHTWLPMMDILGGLTGAVFGIPYVVAERCEGDMYPPGIKTSARRALGRRASAIAANSMAGAAYWSGHPKVIVIPNGIDAKGIREARPLQASERQRPRIICMARLAAQKNQLKLIEAMPRIVSRVPRITLHLLGDGPDLSLLKAAAADLGVGENVEFAGFQQNVWSWMKAAHIAVLISHFEGTPNVALEAAAAGCPMVLSDIPAHRAAFSSAEAVFVDKDDPDSIAAGILKLLEDRDLRKNMIRCAADRVANLTIDAAVSRYLELYLDVADADAR